MTERDLEIQTLRRELNVLKKTKLSTLHVDVDDVIIFQHPSNDYQEDSIRRILEVVTKSFPDHIVIAIPDNSSIYVRHKDKLIEFLRLKGVDIP